MSESTPDTKIGRRDCRCAALENKELAPGGAVERAVKFQESEFLSRKGYRTLEGFIPRFEWSGAGHSQPIKNQLGGAEDDEADFGRDA